MTDANGKKISLYLYLCTVNDVVYGIVLCVDTRQIKIHCIRCSEFVNSIWILLCTRTIPGNKQTNDFSSRQ